MRGSSLSTSTERTAGMNSGMRARSDQREYANFSFHSHTQSRASICMNVSECAWCHGQRPLLMKFTRTTYTFRGIVPCDSHSHPPLHYSLATPHEFWHDEVYRIAFAEHSVVATSWLATLRSSSNPEASNEYIYIYTYIQERERESET